jgi:class 3 adenylate cyclase/tetratricopeptide (TPR) repeat protein
MRCPSCNSENTEATKFCGNCGAALRNRCTKCGSENPPQFRFCGECGASLQAPSSTLPQAAVGGLTAAEAFRPPSHLAAKILTGRSALEGERRQVTVLFGDIVEYTAMAEKLDPEEVHEIVGRAFERITAEIHRFEGTINQYGGDGLMALFGAPIAHEDAARRAVHSALGIQRAVREYAETLERERGLRLLMRIGINTGVVVVGRIGNDLHMEYTAIGDTINLASRLQTLAQPGSILISDATQKAVSGFFEMLERGELEIKGHEPVHAFEVLRARGRRARLDIAAERGLTPLVGRERQLATLGELFGEVKAGHGQLAFVSGEAGIGKSRLILEFRRRLAAAGEQVTWLEGRCVSFGASTPMLPVIDQLRENFQIEENDGEPEIIAKVEHGMRRIGSLASEIPYIRYLLAVDPGDSVVLAMDAAERRTRTFNALRSLTMRAVPVRPIVLVFEDMHWVDSSTQEYLAFLMDSLAGVALLLILTHRVGYKPPFGSRSFHSTINLRHLTEEQSIDMAARFLGMGLFPEQLKSALMQKAEGVPLFVEEVTKTLIDLGVLARDNGSYRIAKALGEMTIPETIQGIIMARLDRLGGDGKRTVQLAAVIGRQFIVKLLERIAGLSGKLEGLLRELKALEIIYEQGLIAEPAYIFKHAVIQDVAYNSLLLQSRKELHRAVGVAVEELYRDRLPEHYAELAYHFTRGEDCAKAMQYGTLAGDQAAHSFANAEAEQHYARALEAASKLPLADSAAVADLHAKRGTVLSIVGRHEDALNEHERALGIVRAGNDRRHECQVLLGFSEAHFNARGMGPAIERSEQALAIARELGDPSLQGLCSASHAFFSIVSYGPTPEILNEAEKAVRFIEPIDNPRLAANAKVPLGAGLQWRGDFDRALVLLHEGVELARSAHSGFALGQALFGLGHACLSLGEYEKALNWYQQLQEYAQAAGDTFFLARVPNCIAAVHQELYDLDRALELNLEGEEAGRRFTAWPEPLGHSLLKAGLVHFERTEHGRAEELFLRAWALLGTDDIARWRWHIPLLHARGALALARGHHDEARRHAVESLEMATRFWARKHAARAQRLQGEILVANGRFEEGAAMLEASVQLAEELKTPREVWTGRSALGKVLVRLGKDREAEKQFMKAAATIEVIAGRLTTPALAGSFLGAERVRDVYRLLGRRPPAPVS